MEAAVQAEVGAPPGGATAKRLICMVHGVGSQTRGEFLSQVVAPLMRLITFWGNRPGPSPVVNSVFYEAQIRPESGPAHASIEFSHGGVLEQWTFVEANWAAAFYAEREFEVLAWGWRMLFESGSMIGKMFADMRGRNDLPAADRGYQDAGQGPGNFYDVFVGIVLGIAWIAVYLVALVAGLVFLLLAQLPSWLIFPGFARQLVRGAVEFLMSGVGDMLAMIENPASLASIVNVMAAAMAPHFAGSPSTWPQNLVIVGHSGGATAAFYAVTDKPFWQRVAGTDAPPVTTTLMTVGSSLNFAARTWKFGMYARGRPFLWGKQFLEKTRWVDISTRYDPVPHGLPEQGMLARIKGGADVCVARFVNNDSFLSDHGAYWENYEEFDTRLVYEIMDREEFGFDRIDFDAIKSHRRTIGQINGWRLIVGVGLLAALTVWTWLFNGYGVSRAAFDWLGSLPVLSLVQGVLSLVSSQPALVFVADLVVLGVAAYALWSLIRILFAAQLYPPWTAG